MQNKFKKGLLLGGILTTLAIAGFAMTKKGSKLTADLQEDLKSLTQKMKGHLEDLEDVTEEKYNELVHRVMEGYNKKRKWTGKSKTSLKSALKGKWKEMEKVYKHDKKAA